MAAKKVFKWPQPEFKFDNVVFKMGITSIKGNTSKFLIRLKRIAKYEHSSYFAVARTNTLAYFARSSAVKKKCYTMTLAWKQIFIFLRDNLTTKYKAKLKMLAKGKDTSFFASIISGKEKSVETLTPAWILIWNCNFLSCGNLIGKNWLRWKGSPRTNN